MPCLRVYTKEKHAFCRDFDKNLETEIELFVGLRIDKVNSHKVG